jgi:hypothetical protein
VIAQDEGPETLSQHAQELVEESVVAAPPSHDHSLVHADVTEGDAAAAAALNIQGD